MDEIKTIELVIMSRKRPKNMPELFRLLPNAVVTVDEREVEDYAPYVPEGRIIPHPPLSGAPACRNWIFDNIDADVVVMFDDDLKSVKSLVGSMRTITDPLEIEQIIYNAARCSLDLGVNVFCFSRSENVMFLSNQTEPVKAKHPAYACIGVIGKAKKIRWDENLKSRADLDWSLQVLCADRIVFCDTRFYFDFGASFSGAGGNSGMMTAKDFENGTKEVKMRWGKHCRLGGNGIQKNRSTSSASINVQRKAKQAYA